MDNVTVQDNPGEKRYDLYVEGQLAGRLTYQRSTKHIALTHTNVAPEFEGQGLAAVLARYALDDARSNGRAVLPFCPYVRAYIQRHHEYLDLVLPEDRERFELPAA